MPRQASWYQQKGLERWLKAAPRLLEARAFSHKATALNTQAQAKMEVADQADNYSN